MNRRDFLRMLGVGAAAAAVPAVLVPERRIWQVPANAPVGRRIASVRGLAQHAGYLVTYGDHGQEVVPYDRIMRMGYDECSSLYAHVQKSGGVDIRDAPYEEYQHLLEAGLTVETDSGHTYYDRGEIPPPGFYQPEPSVLPRYRGVSASEHINRIDAETLERWRNGADLPRYREARALSLGTPGLTRERILEVAERMGLRARFDASAPGFTPSRPMLLTKIMPEGDAESDGG